MFQGVKGLNLLSAACPPPIHPLTHAENQGLVPEIETLLPVNGVTAAAALRYPAPAADTLPQIFGRAGAAVGPLLPIIHFEEPAFSAVVI